MRSSLARRLPSAGMSARMTACMTRPLRYGTQTAQNAFRKLLCQSTIGTAFRFNAEQPRNDREVHRQRHEAEHHQSRVAAAEYTGALTLDDVLRRKPKSGTPYAAPAF